MNDYGDRTLTALPDALAWNDRPAARSAANPSSQRGWHLGRTFAAAGFIVGVTLGGLAACGTSSMQLSTEPTAEDEVDDGNPSGSAAPDEATPTTDEQSLQDGDEASEPDEPSTDVTEGSVGTDQQSPSDDVPNDDLFPYAVCVCEDLLDVGNSLMTESIPTALGITAPSRRGSVGVNGSIGAIGNLSVDGDLVVGEYLTNAGRLKVTGDLEVGHNLSTTGFGHVMGDTNVGGDMFVGGQFATGGTLGVDGVVLPVGLLTYDDRAEASSVSSESPCPCGASQRLDIAGIVASHRGDSRVELSSIGLSALTLADGDFYSDDASLFVGAGAVRIEGKVRLFIEDDVAMFGHRQIDLAPGAKLDVFVSGSVLAVGNFLAGVAEEVEPGAIRLFIGGSEDVSMDVICSPVYYIPGSVYAPNASVRFINANMVVAGSLFVRRVLGFGSLTVLQ